MFEAPSRRGQPCGRYASDSAYNDVNPGSVLLVNISPQLLRRSELYALFGDNVVEFEAQWEWCGFSLFFFLMNPHTHKASRLFRSLNDRSYFG